MQKPCNIGLKWLNLCNWPNHASKQSVKELRRCMRPLTTFMEEQVLSKDPPSPWVMVTPSRCPATVEEETLESRRAGSSKYQRACSQGSFLTPTFLGHSKPLIFPPAMTTSMQTSPSQSTNATNIFKQWVEKPLGSPTA